MAVPTQPTLTSICSEALKKSGISSPSGTTLQTRAENLWMEEIKNDIWVTAETDGDTRFKSLMTQDIQISVDNQSKYDFPSDFDEEISIEILSGDHTGTAQAGANTTITLESGEDVGQSACEGEWILLTSGTGADASDPLRQCVSYDTTTLVATVDRAWTTNPDATTTYAIINDFNLLQELSIKEWSQYAGQTASGEPSYFVKIHEAENVRFQFDVPTDEATYGIRVRYYAKLHKVDLSSSLMNAIYYDWFNVLLAGVYWKALEDADDNRVGNAFLNYQRAKAALIAKEIPFGGELYSMVRGS